MNEYTRGAKDMQERVYVRLLNCAIYYENLAESQRSPAIEQLANIYRIEADEIKAMPLPHKANEPWAKP